MAGIWLCASLLLTPTLSQNPTRANAPGSPNAPLVVQDVSTGDVRNLRVDGRWCIFGREESVQDLNGDGDTHDTVYTVHDLRRGVTMNVGVA